ncbi:MAG: cytochrome c [Chitinophagales bacterium]|nr:cytochrome c [Bacteroidota bacterium]MCB9256687.1 cytochrome c [Chitinophagales bacterium]
MKNLISTLIILFGIFSLQAQDIEAGKVLFKSNCAACHTVGKGKLTGPDLKNVSDRVSPEWIHAFVKNSTAVIESGDAYAVKLFNDYNKTIMTAHPHLSDGDIDNIIAYIGDASVAVVPVTPSGGTQVLNDGTMPVINDTAQSAIDMPVVVMVFWASVVLISAVLISLALIVVRLLK